MTGCNINGLQQLFSDRLSKLKEEFNLSEKNSEDYESRKEEAERQLNNWIQQELIHDNKIKKFEINLLRETMKTLGLSNLELDYDDLEKLYRTLMIEKFAYLNMDNWQEIFGNNTVASGTILKWFKNEALKYTFLDRSVTAPIHVIRTKTDLKNGIIRFKNALCKEIISLLKLENEFSENLQFFNGTCGVDEELFDLLISKITSLIKPSEKILDLTVDANTKEWRLFYDVFTLINFDKLLSKEMEDLINEDDPDFGLLDHVEYSRSEKQQDSEIHEHTDLAQANAIDKISTTAKKLIESIPRVIVSGNNVIQTNSTLSVSDLCQLGGYILNQLIAYNMRHPGNELDLFEDPMETVHTILREIYHGTVEVNHRDASIELQSLIALHLNTAHQFNDVKTTALSLYFYMYASPTKNQENGELDLRTIHTEEQTLGILTGINFELALINEMLKIVTPTYFTFNEHGLLIDADGKPLTDAILNRSITSKATFDLKNAILPIINLGTFGAEETNPICQLLKLVTELDGNHLLFKELRKNSAFIKLINKLVPGRNFDIEHDDTFKNLFTDRNLHTKEQLLILFKKLKEALHDYHIKHPSASFITTGNNSKEIENIMNIIKSSTANYNFDSLAAVLAPIFGSTPVTIIKDIQGNSIPVFRQFSLAFADNHLIQTYKVPKSSEQRIINNYPNYKALRRRCNFFVDHPGILTLMTHSKEEKNNMLLSTTGIKLTTGDVSLSQDARKLSPSDLIIENFSAEFVQLLGLKHSITGEACPMSSTLIGVLSDKTSILTKLLNMKFKIPITTSYMDSEKDPKTGKPLQLTEFKDVSLKNIILLEKGLDILINLDRQYRLTNTIDLVDYIISNWKILLENLTDENGNRIVTEDLDYSIQLSSTGRKIQIKEFLLNPNIWIDITSLSLNTKLDKAGLTALLKKLENCLRLVQQKLLEIINQINNILNKLPKNILDDLSFRLSDIAFEHNIEFVPELFYAKYNETIDGKVVSKLYVNRMLQYDLENLTSQESWKNYQRKQYNTFCNTTIKERKVWDPNNIKDSIIGKYFYDRRKNSDFVKAINSSGLNIYSEINGHYEVNVKNLDNALRSHLIFLNFIRHQYLDLTVKEAYVDPDKSGNIDIEKEIDARIGATNKRNVNFGGSIATLMGKIIGGVGKKTPVAIVDTYEEEVFNLLGKTAGQDILDGCAIMDPIEARMQGLSLCNLNHIQTLKTLGTWISDYTSALAKWAEFQMTNAAIRDSKKCKFDLEIIFERMHNIQFDPNTNICSSYSDPEGQPKTILNLANLTGKYCYYTDGLRYYRVLSLKYKGYDAATHNHTYTKVIQEVDRSGNILTPPTESNPIIINSIYDIYRELGGYNNMEMLNGQLEFSENIMDILYQIVVRYGIKNPNSKSKWADQNNVTLPLRNKFIHILATKSSIKRTWPNMNRSTELEKEVKRSAKGEILKKLTCFYVDLSMTGMQLESFHQSDGSEVTEPTQALAAQAENGYTYDLAKDIYESLLHMIEINGDSIEERNRLLKEHKWKEVAIQLSRKIIQNTDFTGAMSEIDAIIEKEIQRAKFSEDPNNVVLPLSKFKGDISKLLIQDLNKDVIRRKYEASLAGVLNPTSNLKLIFTLDGKSWLYSDIIYSLLDTYAINKAALEKVINDLMTEESTRIYTKELRSLSIIEKHYLRLDMLFKVAAIYAAHPEMENNHYKLNNDIIDFLNWAYLNSTHKDLYSYIDLSGFTGNANTISLVYKFMIKMADNVLVAEDYMQYLKSKNINPLEKSLFLLEPVIPETVLPLDTIINELGEKTLLSTLDIYLSFTLFNNNPYIFIDRSSPADLKPQIRLVTSEDRTECEYNNEAAYANRIIQLLLLLINKKKLDKLREYGKTQNENCN